MELEGPAPRVGRFGPVYKNKSMSSEPLVERAAVSSRRNDRRSSYSRSRFWVSLRSGGSTAGRRLVISRVEVL